MPRKEVENTLDGGSRITTEVLLFNEGGLMEKTCLNCHAEMPDGARACLRCEAMKEDIGDIDFGEVVDFANQAFSPDQLTQLSAMALTTTRDEFIRSLMVGDCPKCRGDQTRDCENDPDINDNCVGHCLDCGHLWCLECGASLPSETPVCTCFGSA